MVVAHATRNHRCGVLIAPGSAEIARSVGRSADRAGFYKSCSMAEREGFEPPIRLPVCRISSAVHSTTLPPLRMYEVGPRGSGVVLVHEGRKGKPVFGPISDRLK